MKRIIINDIDYNNYITEDGRVIGRNLKERRYKINRYKFVTLNSNGKQFFTSVHRLVAMFYIDNELNKPCVNHIDNDKMNNHYTNLEWVTYSENMQHAYDNGFHKKPVGFNNNKKTT